MPAFFLQRGEVSSFPCRRESNDKVGACRVEFHAGVHSRLRIKFTAIVAADMKLHATRPSHSILIARAKIRLKESAPFMVYQAHRCYLRHFSTRMRRRA